MGLKSLDVLQGFFRVCVTAVWSCLILHLVLCVCVCVCVCVCACVCIPQSQSITIFDIMHCMLNLFK